jgi:D-alanyl-D-alanine carboxypeptidase
LRHLLSHTAGLDDFTPRDTGSRRPNLFRTVESRMAAAHVDSLLFAPGADWNYSNMGFITLGRVIELASGRSFYDYLHESVFRRAGMSGADFPELDRVPQGVARGYEAEYAADGTKHYRERFGEGVRGGPEGGAYASAADLLRFVEALRAGRLVSPATFRTLTTPKPDLHSPRYGFGFQFDSAAGIYGHTGGIPGGSTTVDIFDQSGYVLILLANGGLGQRDNVRFALQEMVRRRIAAGQ